MHELSVCQALIDQVETLLGDYPGHRVDVVHVSIGPLSGVDPHLLRRAFPLAGAATPAAEARLELDWSPIRVRCAGCGQLSDAAPARLVCGDCGDWHTTLVSGDELILQRVELQEIHPCVIPAAVT